MSDNDKTIFSTTHRNNSLEEMILLEIARRGGSVVIGSSRRPGEDRDLFDKLARYFGITEAQQQENNKWKKNKWDYTILVAVQRLKDPARAGKNKNPDKSLIAMSTRGFWKLTEVGRATAENLASAT